MSDLVSRINSVVADDLVDRHSFYQLHHFLIGGEPTFQASLWQCLRELRSRKDVLISLRMEEADAEDRIVILKARAQAAAERAAECPSEETRRREVLNAKARMAARKVEAAELSANGLARRRQSVSEEAAFLLDMFERMGGRAALKNWDDKDVQREYWDAKVCDEIRRRLLAGQPLDSGVVGTIEMMHRGAAAQAFLNEAGQPGRELLTDSPTEKDVG